MQINLIELSGYLASALVFLTFYMKTMIPLPIVAILSNVAFMQGGRFESNTAPFRIWVRRRLAM